MSGSLLARSSEGLLPTKCAVHVVHPLQVLMGPDDNVHKHCAAWPPQSSNGVPKPHASGIATIQPYCLGPSVIKPKLAHTTQLVGWLLGWLVGWLLG